MVIPQLCIPVWHRFCDRVKIAGLVDTKEPIHRLVKYRTPAVEPIDPIKDMKADILAVRSGRMTPQEFIESWGYDWRDNLRAFKKFFGELDDTDLTFDIDPRRSRSADKSSDTASESGNNDTANL